MKKIFYISVLIIFFSCDSLEFQKKDNSINDKPIASVYDESFFEKDLNLLLPKNIDKNDSIALARSIIDSWAIQQLLLIKAKENNTENDNAEINDLVRDYRQALLINGYKERLIKQRLDTVIESQEILNYYEKNNNNFRLNEELVKLRYIHFSNELIDKKEVIKLFKNGAFEDLETLESRQLSFKKMMLNDSAWVPLENVLLKLPFSREDLLKKTYLIKKEDSLGLYLAFTKDVLLRNQIAPLMYIEPTIKQMILHKRKLQLIRDIEKIIVKDAIQNKIFKIH